MFDGQAVLVDALTASTTLLQDNRPFSKPRQEVISATPALHERELSKLEALSDALALALRERGISELPAALAARAGTASFAHATLAWLEDDQLGLAGHLDLAERALKSLL